MSNSLKKQFILDGLCCANCAAKIENKVSQLNNVKNVSLNFMNKTLVFEIDEENKFDEIVEAIIKIVKIIEPDVKVIELNDKSTKNEDSQDEVEAETEPIKKIITLVICSIPFMATLLFRFSHSVELALILISYILIGKDVLIKSFKNSLHGRIFDENFLMTIATIGALAINQLPEAVSVMLFYEIGEFFQDLAVDKSRKSIASLMNIKPESASVKTATGIKKVHPSDVNIDDIIVVSPGEKIPLDGIVVSGTSTLDTSALTGESVLRDAEENPNVLSGFINVSGLLEIKVSKRFEDSTVSKILDLVENAASKKAQTENFITKFAQYYTPIVVISAIALAFIPPLFLGFNHFSSWLYRSLIFLVVSCPCALVISIPLSYFSGIGAASKNGILIKGSNYLEALNNVDTVIFDKTGTLTEGSFTVTEILPDNNFTEQEVIEFAAFGESFSKHPIAVSVLKHYGKTIDSNLISDYKEIQGKGTFVKTEKNSILVGNKKLMDDNNIDIINDDASYATSIYVAVDGVYAGKIIISDKVKKDSALTIKQLKELGISRTVLLTGDNSKIASKVADSLSIDQVYSELLPNEKVEKLEYFSNNAQNKSSVVFVGDGINDAPVLARADVGVAMGNLGSDAAIEAADVVLMSDEPSQIIKAIKIARNVRKIVVQNIVLALLIKIVVLLLGAMGIATIWEAVFADVGVALLAVLNASRALKVK